MSHSGWRKALTFALRSLRREWRAGELRVLVAALIVAVGSLSAVGFFTDRMEKAMQSRASELLGADLLISSANPVDEVFEIDAAEVGLATARTLDFRSMLVAGEQLQLAEVKAVNEAYPLRGTLRVAPEPFADALPTESVPTPGNVWLDGRLASVLDLAIGDSIELGAAQFRVEQILAYEPDRGGDLFSIAPRLLMNLTDIERTKLVMPGSRVRYRLLFSGPTQMIDAFRSAIAPRLTAGAHFHGIRDARPEMRAALDRSRQFLGLAALVSVLLAGVAIAVASRRYAARHLDAAAVMRCLGASQSLIIRVYASQILIIGLVGSLIGCALGFGVQSVLARFLQQLFIGELPPPSWLPVGFGVASGVITLAGFALPPLMRLKQVPPARVLRRELGQIPARSWGVYVSALATLTLLIYWQMRDTVLTSYVLGGGVATLVVLSLAALALVKVMSALRGRVGVAWRFGLANISRRAEGSLVQIVAFGLGIMVMLLLTLVRGDLLEEWQGSLPADAPNYFLVNIQPEEVPELRAFLGERDLAAAELYPMVRGRLIRVNDAPLKPDGYADPRARRLAEREFNLSWAETPAPDNRIVAGRWFNADGRPELSVETGIAETLGLGLGDLLHFQIAGREVSAEITSLRTVEWDSFRVNFFVIAAPGVLEDFPSNWITSFHLPAERRTALTELVRTFPSVTVVDVNAILTKVREIMEQAALAVEFVFGFTLIAGLVVLFAAIQSTLDERKFETAVVRTLGGNRRRLMSGLLAEFVTLGVLSGVLAALAATTLGAVLAIKVFSLSFSVNPYIWGLGIVGGGLGVGLAGLLGTRAILDQPPLTSLREG